jgi:hypothetical protein
VIFILYLLYIKSKTNFGLYFIFDLNRGTIMKKVIGIWLTVLLVLTLFTGFYLPVLAEDNDLCPQSQCNGVNSSSRSSSRDGNYIAYYNKTFTIDKSWEADNISVIVFVQTQDQSTKNKGPGGSSGTFSSAEVLQSTIDFLTGEEKRTACCRRVFGELITATWCGNCPGADGAFDRILRNSSLFPGKVTIVELHPSSSGDFYSSDSKARAEWYNYANHHPTAVFDGLWAITGGAGSNPNATNADNMYMNIINQRQPVLPVIDIITFGHKTNSNGWINASIELLSPTPLRNLKVQFMVVEDVYPYKTSRDAYIRHSLRDLLPPEDFIPPNHPPIIVSSLPDVNIDEDGVDSTTVQLAPAFDDQDLDVLTFSSNRDGLNKENVKVEIDETGNVTFTPDENWNGVEEIIFYADDGRAEPLEQMVTVTVTAVNDPPVLASPMYDFTMNEDVPIENKFNLSQVFNDVDLDQSLNAVLQEPLIITYSGNENIGITILNNWVSFDPIPDWNGNETILFTAKDTAGESVTDDVRIWVRSGNDKPVLLKPLPVITIDEDETKNDFIDLNDYFSDTDGDSLTFDVEPVDKIKIKLKNNLVSFIPDPDYWGSEELSFSATDIPGSEPVWGNTTIIVNSVNDAPILNDTGNWLIKSGRVAITDTEISFKQNEEVKIIVTAYDPADKDKLLFSEDTTLFEINPDTGEISLTPTNDQVGSYEVKIKVDDQQAIDNEVGKTFTFIIENVNDPPEIPEILSPTDGNTYISNKEIKFIGDCDDPDLYIPDSGETLVFEWTTEKSSETLSFDKEFTTTLQPGEYTITLAVRDKKGEKTTAEVCITVEVDKTIDTDSDGSPDYLDDDDDGDGMPDNWELLYPNHLDPLDPTDADADPDKDSFTNLEEFLGKDGKPGGNDATNPTKRSSQPKTESSDDSDGDAGAMASAYSIGIIIAVIIVVLVLVFLFLIKKRGKQEGTEEIKGETSSTKETPAPIQPTQEQIQPEQAGQEITNQPTMSNISQEQQMSMPAQMPRQMQMMPKPNYQIPTPDSKQQIPPQMQISTQMPMQLMPPIPPNPGNQTQASNEKNGN